MHALALVFPHKLGPEWLYSGTTPGTCSNMFQGKASDPSLRAVLNTRFGTQRTARSVYDKISRLKREERERQGTASNAKFKSDGTDDTVYEDREEAEVT